MTPTEKWQAVRAALLVTAMLMWWLPNGAQPTGSVSRLVQPLAGRQGGSAAFAVAGGASQASAQTTCKGRYRFPSAPSSKPGAKQPGPSRTQHPGRIALGRSSERNRSGATVRA